jgi:hypothetical protein
MAGVDPATTTFDRDPLLFSLSRNKHRRHLSIDQVSLVAARLATRTVGNPNLAIASNEAIGNAEAAKAAGLPETSIDSAKVVLRYGAPEERKAVESGKAKLRKTADRIRARRRAGAEPDRPNQRPATLRRKKTPVGSRDPIDDVTRDLITKCSGRKAKWRTLDVMSSTAGAAKRALKAALEGPGEDAVKAREGNRGVECLIEGDPDELLIRAGLMTAPPDGDGSCIDSRDEVAGLRAENSDLRDKLADANAEIERLKRALYEDVIEKIAAKFAAKSETKPTVDDVVMAALG